MHREANFTVFMDEQPDGRMHGRTDDGQNVTTLAHTKHSSGELKQEAASKKKISDEKQHILFGIFFFQYYNIGS